MFDPSVFPFHLLFPSFDIHRPLLVAFGVRMIRTPHELPFEVGRPHLEGVDVAIVILADDGESLVDDFLIVDPRNGPVEPRAPEVRSSNGTDFDVGHLNLGHHVPELMPVLWGDLDRLAFFGDSSVSVERIAEFHLVRLSAHLVPFAVAFTVPAPSCMSIYGRSDIFKRLECKSEKVSQKGLVRDPAVETVIAENGGRRCVEKKRRGRCVNEDTEFASLIVTNSNRCDMMA